MRWNRIPDGDSLFRQSVHPLSFKGKGFVWEKCLKLYDQPDGSLLASLTWQRYVPTSERVHSYGCRLAFGMNEKKRLSGTFKEKSRHIYCGAYELKANAIRALTVAEGLNEIISADVVHHVEVGEIAHTNLRIVLRAGGGTDVEGAKTAILDRLWSSCHGPLTHICDCDREIADHPSSGLTTPPAGLYSDSRSSFIRLWHVTRFHILNWIWQRFFLSKG